MREPRRPVKIDALDIDEQDQVDASGHRLSGQALDMLFMNAGNTTHDAHVHISDVSTDEFTRVMVTNALSLLRAVEALQDLVPTAGVIGAMSSRQGSIANNESGVREVYRASKAALNMSGAASRPGERSAACDCVNGPRLNTYRLGMFGCVVQP